MSQQVLGGKFFVKISNPSETRILKKSISDGLETTAQPIDYTALQCYKEAHF